MVFSCKKKYLKKQKNTFMKIQTFMFFQFIQIIKIKHKKESGFIRDISGQGE